MAVNDAPDTRTQRAQALLVGAPTFKEGLARLEGSLIGESVGAYFDALLNRHGLTCAQAAKRADLDADYGRQILKGARATSRDNYLRLALGMALSAQETQSMLNFLGVGPIYPVVERDAALLYAIQRGYTLMDAQLLLAEHGLTPLGDGADPVAANATGDPPPTRDVEHMVRTARDYQCLTDQVGDRFVRIGVAAYFHRLLAARGLSRAQALAQAGLNRSIGFQLISGKRVSKSRDPYLRLALAMRLTLNDTQRMLKFLKKGELYPLKPRDAALVYCFSRRYTLDEAQALLQDNGFAPL